MTPDKVEAALGVLESTRRVLVSQDLREVLMNVQNNINSPACAGMANAALARMDRLPDLREALSVLTEALAERGWRPIESAPRDESQVLIFDPTLCGGFVCIARHWMGEWRHGSLPGCTMFPTHWQPLPEPPHDR